MSISIGMQIDYLLWKEIFVNAFSGAIFDIVCDGEVEEKRGRRIVLRDE